ncbi:hypothetical protein [Parageobacillus sp. G301]|nr:hypothetical protein [Parageobacillus sp. G301]
MSHKHKMAVKELGIDESMVRRWVKRYEIERTK